jgi:hypothetical protein
MSGSAHRQIVATVPITERKRINALRGASPATVFSTRNQPRRGWVSSTNRGHLSMESTPFYPPLFRRSPDPTRPSPRPFQCARWVREAEMPRLTAAWPGRVRQSESPVAQAGMPYESRRYISGTSSGLGADRSGSEDVRRSCALGGSRTCACSESLLLAGVDSHHRRNKTRVPPMSQDRRETLSDVNEHQAGKQGRLSRLVLTAALRCSDTGEGAGSSMTNHGLMK